MPARAIVEALLRRDEARLAAALNCIDGPAIAADRSYPVYFAAALAGWAEAVPRLATAGIPISAADKRLRRRALNNFQRLEPGLDLPLSKRAMSQLKQHGQRWTPLAWAVAQDNTATVTALLDAGADPNGDGGSCPQQQRPLGAALNLAQQRAEQQEEPGSATAMAEQLLQAGADIARVYPDASSLLYEFYLWEDLYGMGAAYQHLLLRQLVTLLHTEQWSCPDDDSAWLQLFETAASFASTEAADGDAVVSMILGLLFQETEELPGYINNGEPMDLVMESLVLTDSVPLLKHWVAQLSQQMQLVQGKCDSIAVARAKCLKGVWEGLMITAVENGASDRVVSTLLQAGVPVPRRAVSQALWDVLAEADVPGSWVEANFNDSMYVRELLAKQPFEYSPAEVLKVLLTVYKQPAPTRFTYFNAGMSWTGKHNAYAPCPAWSLCLKVALTSPSAYHRIMPTALGVAEALAAAGCRPSCSSNVLMVAPDSEYADMWLKEIKEQVNLDEVPRAERYQPSLPLHYVALLDPAEDDPRLRAAIAEHSECRHLWMILKQEPWTPAAHRNFPPDFKAAVRTLLLAAHRGSTTEQHGAACTLFGSLPPLCMQNIAAMMAYPFSAWRACGTGGGGGGAAASPQFDGEP